MTLAGPGDSSGVVEAQSVDLGKADQQRRAIRVSEQRLLRLEGARDDQEVMIDHIEFIQQGDMGRGDLRHVEIGIVRQKGVVGRLCGLRLLLLCQGRENAHLKCYAALLDDLRRRGDGLDRSAAAGMGRLFEQGGPQGAGLEESIVLTHTSEKDTRSAGREKGDN